MSVKSSSGLHRRRDKKAVPSGLKIFFIFMYILFSPGYTVNIIGTPSFDDS